MKTWKLVAGVLIIFILGTLFGLLPGFLFRNRFPLPPPMLPPPMDREGRDFFLEALTRDLVLNENQKIRVKEITAEMKKKLGAHFLQMQPEIKSIFDGGFAEIEKVLDDNQKKKLHKMREMIERQRPFGGAPMPPPHS
jgi:hypothetical protein